MQVSIIELLLYQYLPSMFSFSPSFFKFVFVFNGAVGAPTPEAPDDDVPPLSKVEAYVGGLDPDGALLLLVWFSTGLLSSSSSSLSSCKAFNALGMDELFGLEVADRDRFADSD